MENKIMMVPVLLLLAVSVASAARFEYDETPMLLAVYEQAKCRVDFTNDLIDSMVDNIPESEYLSDYQDTLEDNLDELHDLAEDGDRHDFKEYMRGTFQEDFRGTKEAMREARGNFREWNISLETKLELLGDYLSLNETYAECDYEAMQEVADERLNWMNTVLEHWSERSDDLSDKGVDTSGVDDVIEDARETIVDALEDEVDDATTGHGIRKAMWGYCLGNGCPNGKNHHFYAKAEIAKLNGILDYLEEDAEEAGLEEEVDEAEGYL